MRAAVFVEPGKIEVAERPGRVRKLFHYLTDSDFGGRPRRGMSPTSGGRRPVRNKALRKRSSTCALVLRSSSEAQRASASCTAGSMRTSSVFLSGIESNLTNDQNRSAQVGILDSLVFTTRA